MKGPVVNLLTEIIHRRGTALGVQLSYGAPECIEALARGWDWVWLDAQHGQHDYAALLRGVQLCRAAGAASVVRTPGHCPDAVGPVIDTGVDALMVPMVNSGAEARGLVKACFFPPLGARSYGGRRVIDAGGREYYRGANAGLMLIAQIETPEAVERVEEIASVEGVGALFFGAEDVKIRLGVSNSAGMLDSPEVARAMERTARAARGAGKAAGCVAPPAADLQRAVVMGYNFMRGGGDIQFLAEGARTRLRELGLRPPGAT
jgi:2-keto-3-deoxy-L-rhamnonate aldolase RhmA